MRKLSVLLRLAMNHEAYIPEILARKDFGNFDASSQSPYMCNLIQLPALGFTAEEIAAMTLKIREWLVHSSTLYSHFNYRDIPFTQENVLQFWEDCAKDLESFGL